MRFWKSSPDFETSVWHRLLVTAVAITLAAAGGLQIACRAPATSVPAPAYQPFYAVPAGPPEARGTLKGDYQWAAGSTAADEAATRWRAFLQSHEPPDGEYQDAFQRNYVRSAQYELMRAEYLLGRAREGDVLLRELEDVQGEQ